MRGFYFGLLLLLVCGFISPLFAADSLKDFRATSQRAALVGAFYSGTETGVEKRLLQDFRKEINHYTRSFGESSIAQFVLGENTGGRFFAPARELLSDEQKKFMKEACKANEFDLFVLSAFDTKGGDINAALQVFDCRIDSLSGVETETFASVGSAPKVASFIYRLMDSLDRDGFVHSSRQGFVVAPALTSSTGLSSMDMAPESEGLADTARLDDAALNPGDLSTGRLAGSTVIGGDQRPFWEKAWFWTVIGGSVLVAGGLSYYFLVVNQPPTSASVGFRIP